MLVEAAPNVTSSAPKSVKHSKRRQNTLKLIEMAPDWPSSPLVWWRIVESCPDLVEATQHLVETLPSLAQIGQSWSTAPATRPLWRSEGNVDVFVAGWCMKFRATPGRQLVLRKVRPRRPIARSAELSLHLVSAWRCWSAWAARYHDERIVKSGSVLTTPRSMALSASPSDLKHKRSGARPSSGGRRRQSRPQSLDARPQAVEC